MFESGVFAGVLPGVRRPAMSPWNCHRESQRRLKKSSSEALTKLFRSSFEDGEEFASVVDTARFVELGSGVLGSLCNCTSDQLFECLLPYIQLTFASISDVKSSLPFSILVNARSTLGIASPPLATGPTIPIGLFGMVPSSLIVADREAAAGRGVLIDCW